MPTNLFQELKDDKKQAILAAAISEFAQHGYAGSSTNRIVKNAGISKGSLFTYFTGKEDLYFHVLACVTGEFTDSIQGALAGLPGDLFHRVIEYAGLEFSWYIQNLEKYALILKAFSKNDTEMYRKTQARFNYEGRDMYYSLLEGVDTTGFRGDRKKTLDVLRWVLQGFNEEFIGRAAVQQGDAAQLGRLKQEYAKELTGYMELLKEGFLQPPATEEGDT